MGALALLASLLAGAPAAQAAEPGARAAADCPAGLPCGSYAVDGLGARKSEVRGAGASTLDLAIAMLESDRMSSDYAYGDNKTGDAANFGIFKQNWLMLHDGCGRFSGQDAGRYDNGAVLNSDLGADLTCLHESQAHYGIDTWFAGHRNGSSGIENPGTQDIANYRNAVYWIRDQIEADPAALGNDTRYWVDVTPI
ncbi:hypothetical protein AB0J21_07420 [Streptomyces sp. NPDC049954]|uniref:hypothetical protein n=1 Tax=Streptomyces sp. NPDC049954 TaxID=3155779 RepID=UPI0034348A8F